MERQDNLGRIKARNPTPTEILKHIEQMYSYWIRFDSGLLLAIKSICDHIGKSEFLIPSRVKTKYSDQTKFTDTLNSINFEFRGSSKLFNSIGCISPGINNALEFSKAMLIVENELVSKVVLDLNNYIESTKLYPIINNESLRSRVKFQVLQNIRKHIHIGFDTQSKRFFLILEK